MIFDIHHTNKKTYLASDKFQILLCFVILIDLAEDYNNRIHELLKVETKNKKMYFYVIKKQIQNNVNSNNKFDIFFSLKLNRNI